MKSELKSALDEYDSESVASDDALCDLLGIQSLHDVTTEHCASDDDCDENDRTDDHYPPKKCQSVNDLIHVSDDFITKFIQKYDVVAEYRTSNVCILPLELSIPASIMRRLTDELVWGHHSNEKNGLGIDRTFETTKFMKNGMIHGQSTLTRLENLNGHAGWYDLCNDYIRRCVSKVCGEEMILYKTKLNLKPPGGSGFAPHVDTPSLIVPFLSHGPQTFVTVMIAIDDMTTKNGCLRVVKSSAETRCPTVPPDKDGNPDSNGRAGAIPMEVANTMNFEDLCCTAGTICIFDGWVPHRSGTNQSNFARRAVFLTYNPTSEGDYYDLYYQRMKQMRHDWKASLSIASSTKEQQDPEIEALSSIPRI